MLRQLLGVIVLLPQAALANFWDGMKPGTISFKKHGLCASGQPAYFGVIEPVELIHSDKMFVETMGGAICFNRASCNNHELRLWTDIDMFLTEGLGLDLPVANFLKSGAALPLQQLAVIADGGLYNPSAFSTEHPWYGMRGLFAVMCTADIFVGKHNATYEPVHVQGSGPRKDCDEANDGNGANYVGCQNTTNSGMACLPWPDDTPKSTHDNNYCRNHDGRSQIWCRTHSQGWHFDYDYCDAVIEAPKPTTVYHHGGLNQASMLAAAKVALPNITFISTYGSSGGGVASVAWASMLADMWTEAKVVALADGALHTFPGTRLFDYFWDKSPYGAGPGGQASAQYDVITPDFDWREVDALAKHLKSHEGRVTIAYMSCIDDEVVYLERKRLAFFADLTGAMQELLDPVTQHDRTWRFLNNLQACSPEGSAFSFIGNCSTHHLLKSYRGLKISQANISVVEFSDRVLRGLNPVPGSKASAKLWYEDKESTAADLRCPSAVRRRRGVAPTPAPAPAKEDGEKEADLACLHVSARLGVLMAYTAFLVTQI